MPLPHPLNPPGTSDEVPASLSMGFIKRLLYKCAYKKYYARYMKGNMSEAEFKAWGEQAAAQRDFTIELLKATKSEEKKMQYIMKLRNKLNQI